MIRCGMQYSVSVNLRNALPLVFGLVSSRNEINETELGLGSVGTLGSKRAANGAKKVPYVTVTGVLGCDV